MKKSRVLILFVVTVILFVCGGFTCNAETVASGECGAEGSDVAWELDDSGKLTISGEGDMADYSESVPPYMNYAGSITSVEICEGVTRIGDLAFAYCDGIKEIIIPEGVTSIGSAVVGKISGLTTIELPSTITSIDSYAFSGCIGLESINIPSGIETISDGCFSQCVSLKSISLPDSVTGIDINAFSMCTGLESVELSDGLVSIGENAFWFCESLESITVPDSVTSIHSNAFLDCANFTIRCRKNSYAHQYAESNSIRYVLIDEDGNEEEEQENIIASGRCGTNNVRWSLNNKGVVKITGTGRMDTYDDLDHMLFDGFKDNIKKAIIEDGVTNIGGGAFYQCSKLTSVEVADSVTEIGSFAFYQCSRLKSINIPNNTSAIGIGAFWGCSALESVHIPAAMRSVGRDTFNGCSALSSLQIDNGLVTIGERAFSGCESLTVLSIPNSVTGIGEEAFAGCDSIKSVTLSNRLESLGEKAFYQCSSISGISLPDTLTAISKSAFEGCAGLISATLPAGLKSIGEKAFCECSGITTLSIPDSVTNIDMAAFCDCTGLRSVNIPHSMSAVSWCVFAGCTSLTGITIPDNITQIGGEAFMGCSSITTCTIPDSVQTIGMHAFDGCSSLSRIRLPKGLTDIEEGTFQGCSSLSEITIPESVTYIGWIAFNNSGLTRIEIPQGVTEIRNHTFEDCKNLREVSLPVNLTRIGFGTFQGCENLRSITIPEKVSAIEGYTFNNCFSLSEVVIPSSVTAIGPGAFGACHGLKFITIPSSVTTIGDEAFVLCSNLKTIRLPDSVITMGDGAFKKCSNLTGAELSRNLTLIPDNAFSGCGKLMNIEIHSGATAIGSNAFKDCRYISKATIPRSVSSIEDNSFEGCGLFTIYGYKDSYAHEYADRKNIPFYSLDPTAEEVVDTGTVFCDSASVKLSTLLGKETFEEYVSCSDAKEYNPKLAYILSILATATYDQSYVDKSLKSMGYDTTEGADVVHDYRDDYTAAYTVAKKQLDDGTWFVIIAVRGSYNLDWATNANIGITLLGGMGKHQGFSDGANQIYETIESFVGDPKTMNATYVITGHSQGAAVANLLSVQLSDNEVRPNRVFDYNYGCPNVACLLNPLDWNPDTKHDNIYNIGDMEDPVTFLPSNIIHNIWFRLLPTTWGKFGQTVWFKPSVANQSPGNCSGHDMKYYIKALSQLAQLSAFYRYEQLPASTIMNVIGIHCPVDVVVYDENGKPVASVINNEANYYDSTFGEVMILVDGDEKWVFLRNDKKYRVSITATDEGEMKYEVYNADFSNNLVIDEKTIDNIGLDDNKQMMGLVGENENGGLFVLDNNGSVQSDINEDGTEVPHVHDWAKDYTADKPATCTEDGVESIHCSVCNTKDERAIPAAGHIWNKEYTIDKKATYAAKGSKSIHCSECNAIKPYSAVTISKLTVKPTNLSKVIAASKGFTVKWKKGSGITGYQVQYALNSKFTSGKKTVNVTKATTVSKKFTKLKAKKKYYVKVRTYKTYKGKKYYSKWSKAKAVTTKS